MNTANGRRALAMTREELEELVEAHQAELFRFLRFIGADYSFAEDMHAKGSLRGPREVLNIDFQITK